MDYYFEALGDERFQQLAQALLTLTFPDVQCLPVGQPDGGRDAFRVIPGSHKRRFLVFQVKFSKHPHSKEERDAIEGVIKSEKEKVEVLKSRGAQSYYLISNVAGTAHLEHGSIDRVNALLTQEFGIPSYCWWRDDLTARISTSSSVKWSFPEILRGTDVLQLLVEGSWRENAEVRHNALHSYIVSQYYEDDEVKFRQVELQNKLLDLFVDLPLENASQGSFFADKWVPVEREFLIDEDAEAVYRFRRKRRDAATKLLGDGAEPNHNKIVLEGAPGQGKSTIAQYVCQVHRIKILDKSTDLSLIPENHRKAPLRIPFRIDLRDYASWLTGKNPFSPEGQPSGSSQSLESFIAAQVMFGSGGLDFTASDLVAVVKTGNISIVLDGFDEVADIAIRKKMVEEISKAAMRIQAHERATQFIVTSRPAAFANSPGFPHGQWVHFELQAMTHPQIDQYAAKWMAARKLKKRERDEFTSLLKEKLKEPHMRDLARNPMQLTILLALIHTRGLSLPDKRTSLYDNYMEQFFNRESEKSRIVREYRELLIDIHRYLAWKLHTAAEGSGGNGSITEEELKTLLKSYLEREGHSTSLVDELFTGMVERVVALVSRVQGTFEFEVQPLREYFAARHLYDTAPYSPPGDERPGTKPERFDALARNFFWLNVLRFYCGCYSRGELSSLADGLLELAHSTDYGRLAHPRTLAITLLNDWVFSQQPLAVKRVVEALFEQPGLKILLSHAMRSSDGVPVLPHRCGRSELTEQAMASLSTVRSSEDRSALLTLVRANTDLEAARVLWNRLKPSETGDQRKWLTDGDRLGILKSMTQVELEQLISEYGVDAIQILCNSGRYDAIESRDDYRKVALERLFDGKNFGTFPGSEFNVYAFLSFLLKPSSYRRVFEGKRMGSTINVLLSDGSFDPAAIHVEHEGPLKQFLDAFTSRLSLDVTEWASSTVPWHCVISDGVGRFGPRWTFKKLAVLAAGIRSSSDLGVEPTSIWQATEDLCAAMRFARLRSGNVSWWKRQIGDHLEGEELKLALLTMSVWATPRTILHLSEVISKAFDRLDSRQWFDTFGAFLEIDFAYGGLSSRSPMAPPPPGLSPRLAVILARRGNEDYMNKVYTQRLSTYDGTDGIVTSFIAEAAVLDALKSSSRWPRALNTIRAAYASGVTAPTQIPESKMPLKVADGICSDANAYPQWIVRIAQRCLAASLGAKAPKLGQLAESEKWFA
jgi:hypothetical protein